MCPNNTSTLALHVELFQTKPQCWVWGISQLVVGSEVSKTIKPTTTTLGCCIGYFSTALIKQHDQGNWKKEGFIIQRVRDSLLSWWGAWQQAGKHGSRAPANNSPQTGSRGNSKRSYVSFLGRKYINNLMQLWTLWSTLFYQPKYA